MNFSIEEVDVQGEYVEVKLSFSLDDLLQDHDLLEQLVTNLINKAFNPEEETDW